MSFRPGHLLTCLRRRAAQERGAAAVVVAVSMVVFLGFAALAINVGSMYQAQRQAQAAADAAALAAADDLGTATASSATSDATTYATTNYPGSTPTATVNAAGSQVTVNVTASTPTFLGGLFGASNFTVGAKAVAGRGPGTPCATAGDGCYAIYTSDTNCGTTSSPNYGITMNGKGNVITGGVHSEGGIDLVGGSQSLGPTTFSNASSACKVTQGGTGDTFSTGPTSEAPIGSWPDDYSTVLTACGGTGQVACTGPNNTPSYCTQAAASFNFGNGSTLTSGNVYCAYGTGTISNPATWNGTITFTSGNLGAAGAPIYGTWIGGTIDIEHQSYLAPQASTPSYPLFYALGSGTCASASVGGICMSASNNYLTGALFSPNGSINFNGAGSTSNFLEAKDVTLTGGGFSGDGPTLPSGTSSGGGVTLLQ